MTQNSTNIISIQKKPLGIIEKKEDRDILTEICNFLTEPPHSISAIQINKLVLNDIEYPTEYAKIKQTKLELISRYNSIVDIYYDIKKKELETELLDEEINNEKHPIKKKMKELDKEKAILYIHSAKYRLNAILKELNIYYDFYKNSDNRYKHLDNEKEYKLEEEMWHKKALSNPVVFEERYGKFLEEILGEKKYNNYKERRKISIGTFPRELI